MAGLSADIKQAGIERVTDQYLDEVEWDDLIPGSSKVDIVVAYAATWRNTHRARLESVTRRKNTRTRVFLPDSDDVRTMEILAERFGRTAESLREEVRSAISDFASLATPGGGDVEVHARAGDAVFSCYRFDGRAVLTLYSHARKRRSNVPTFVLRSGQLWTFLYEDIQDIKEQSRRVFPEEQEVARSE